MFGDSIYGQCEQIIERNSRINLPTFTKREEGDNIVLIEDKELNIYKIYNIKQIDEWFNKLNEQLLTSKTENEEKLYKKRIYELSKTILRSGKVDKFGRTSFGECLAGISKVKLIGAGDHLVLELKK